MNKEDFIKLGNKIPCKVCCARGYEHIKEDGSCKHRPLSEKESYDRLVEAVKYYENNIRPPDSEHWAD